MRAKPKLAIGDEFYSDGEKWEVIDEPFWNPSVIGEQWWYPSRRVGRTNITESLVDALTEDNDG